MMSELLSNTAVVTVGALVTAGLLTGCSSDNPVGPTASPPFTVTELRVGTGAEAANGNTLTVDYTGWLHNPAAVDNKGFQFDTSGGQGFTFVLGAGTVIPGWDQGLVGMRVGGERRLVIPPDRAYGQSGSGSIPGNATLLFDVELVSIP